MGDGKRKLKLDGAGCKGFLLTVGDIEGNEITTDLSFDEAWIIIQAMMEYHKLHMAEHLANALAESIADDVQVEECTCEDDDDVPEGAIEIEPEPQQLDWIEQLERDLNGGSLNG